MPADLRKGPRPHRSELAESMRLTLSGHAAQLYGPAWSACASQAAVWAMILLEIPQQLATHNQAKREALAGRREELAAMDPDDREIADIEHRLRLADTECQIVSSNDSRSCVTARIVRTLGQWPDSRERVVEFALCRDSELWIRCVGTPPHMPKLPERVLMNPPSIDAARNKAAELVRAAIQLVDGDWGRHSEDVDVG